MKVYELIMLMLFGFSIFFLGAVLAERDVTAEAYTLLENEIARPNAAWGVWDMIQEVRKEGGDITYVQPDGDRYTYHIPAPEVWE